MYSTLLACGNLTYTILGLVVLLGELIAVTEEKFPTPDIENSANGEVTFTIVLSLNCSSLTREISNDTN